MTGKWVIPKMPTRKLLCDPFEIAMRTAAGEFRFLSTFERHEAARDYWVYVLNMAELYPWKSDRSASEWLEQYEEIL